MADNTRDGHSGQKFWGTKTLSYAKKLSRESIEKHTDTSVLYFEIDIVNSKKNFYGELLVKKFVNPQGLAVKGIIDLTEGGDVVVEDIPNQILKLKFSCYVNHLQELGINPKIGDYFATKNRIYYIWRKQITDANSASVGVDREAVTIIFECVQSDDEQAMPDFWGNGDTGTKNDILGERQINNGISLNDGQQ